MGLNTSYYNMPKCMRLNIQKVTPKLIKHNMLVDINIYEIQLGHCISKAICVSQILNVSLKGQINGNISISNNTY